MAISPDGSTVAAGGYTEPATDRTTIYVFDRESGTMVKPIHDDLPNVVVCLTFAPDGRYLAATLAGGAGLRVFDRDKDWSEASRDDAYQDYTYGAAFAPDGRLATTSFGDGGTIRLYDSNFRLVGKSVKAPSGNRPFHAAFSPDGRLLALGYEDIAAVDLLDGNSLERVPGPSLTSLDPGLRLREVAWSQDGRTLFAAYSSGVDARRNVIMAWDEAGLGQERRLTYCGPDLAAGIDALPDGRILVASFLPCLGLMTADGKTEWTVRSPLADFRYDTDTLDASADGKVVDFDFGDAARTQLRFDVRSLRLTREASGNGLTFAPNREGLKIEGWRNGSNPTLNGRAIPIDQYEESRSLAVAGDGKRFFLGSDFALAAFDETGARKWQREARNEVWAVNASKDGRIVVAAYADGAIRWHRADDGRELLALQVLPNKTDWVLWTPEGFYEATQGAKDVLKWVVNHGPDKPATTLPVSAIPNLHRPDALPRAR